MSGKLWKWDSAIPIWLTNRPKHVVEDVMKKMSSLAPTQVGVFTLQKLNSRGTLIASPCLLNCMCRIKRHVELIVAVLTIKPH